MQAYDREYIVVHPFSSKYYMSLTPKERANYYTWFMSVKADREKYLCRKCASYLNIDRSTLDYSRASLQHIWRFVLTVGTIEDFSEDTLENAVISGHLSKRGITAKELFLRPEKQLTQFSQLLLLDVGMYVGDTFVNEYPSLQWGKHKLKDVNHNLPVIKGFTHMYNSNFHPVVEPVGFCQTLANVLLKPTIPHNAEEMLLMAFDNCCCNL